MSYTPSEAAVEALMPKAQNWIHGGRCNEFCEYERSHYQHAREMVKDLLVAFMGETVTEPCANPRCENGCIYWAAEVGPSRSTGFDPCPDCPSPRSLAVVECEAAGLLRVAVVGRVKQPNGVAYLTSLNDPGLFYAAAPSTGREPKL